MESTCTRCGLDLGQHYVAVCRGAFKSTEESSNQRHLFPVTTPVSRETTLLAHQYASPCCSPSTNPTRTQVRNRAEPWIKPLPPLPEQRPSQPTQRPFYQVSSLEAYPAHSQFASETEPMPITSPCQLQHLSLGMMLCPTPPSLIILASNRPYLPRFH